MHEKREPYLNLALLEIFKFGVFFHSEINQLEISVESKFSHYKNKKKNNEILARPSATLTLFGLYIIL